MLLVEKLGICGQWVEEWTYYIVSLNRVGIWLKEEEDVLVWSWNNSFEQVCAKFVYVVISQLRSFYVNKCWYYRLWKWKMPLKLKCFFCLVMENCILTWDNLVRRGWNGRNMRLLYQNDGETTNHLFVYCSFCIKIWKVIYEGVQLSPVWGIFYVEKNFEQWVKKTIITSFYQSLFIGRCGTLGTNMLSLKEKVEMFIPTTWELWASIKSITL